VGGYGVVGGGCCEGRRRLLGAKGRRGVRESGPQSMSASVGGGRGGEREGGEREG
jgi:hypothetical protein